MIEISIAYKKNVQKPCQNIFSIFFRLFAKTLVNYYDYDYYLDSESNVCRKKRFPGKGHKSVTINSDSTLGGIMFNILALILNRVQLKPQDQLHHNDSKKNMNILNIYLLIFGLYH